MPGKSRNALAALAVLAMAVFWSKTVRADLTELTSRPMGEDTINWGQFGIPVANVPTPASFTSAGGITGTVSLNSSGTVSQYEQCCIGVSGSFDGNFSKGDMVLYNNGNGPLTLTFDTPVQNAGAQILFNTYGAFTAHIEAFSGSTDLGGFSESGVTTTNADGSAIFLGVEGQSQGSPAFSTTSQGPRVIRICPNLLLIKLRSKLTPPLPPLFRRSARVAAWQLLWRSPH